MKSYQEKKENIKRNWYIIDAEGLVLGRLSTEVANILRGKNKPTYTPNQDCGDFVIIINAEKVKVMKENYPEEMLERAIKGMIPHTRLGRKVAKKLFVYRGSEHPHMAQQPKELKLKGDK